MSKKYFITKDGKRLLARYGRDGFVTIDASMLYNGNLFVTEQEDLTWTALELYHGYFGTASNPDNITLTILADQLKQNFVEMDYVPIAEKRLNIVMIHQYRDAQYQTIMQASALINNIVVCDDDELLESYIASLDKAMNYLHTRLNAKKKANK